jgi:hypothetical protein
MRAGLRFSFQAFSNFKKNGKPSNFGIMESKFQQWANLVDDTRAKDDVDALIMLARLTRFYAKTVAESHIVQGSLKADVSFIHGSCNSFLSRFRKGIKPDQLQFYDERLQRPFEPWGTILQGLTYLNEGSIEAVERFVVGICNGSIDAKVVNGTQLIINEEKLDSE